MEKNKIGGGWWLVRAGKYKHHRPAIATATITLTGPAGRLGATCNTAGQQRRHSVLFLYLEYEQHQQQSESRERVNLAHT
jgi:hypothetical protein